MTAHLPLAALVRAELQAYVGGLGRRRAAGAVVYVGRLAGPRAEVSDAGLTGRETTWRADLLERAIDGVEDPVHAWLTRCGDPTPNPADLAWCAAARIAFARHGLALPAFHLLTRYGWRDLLSGEAVTFSRVRNR